MIHYRAGHIKKTSVESMAESLYSWIVSSGHPSYIISTNSSLAVVVNNLCIRHRENNMANVKEYEH